MSNNTSYEHTFYKTFSGADSLAFMLLPNSSPILLGSLTTVSYSMYRDKKPVTLIGKVNVSGYTRGMRVIAGTMVFTLINQHLTKDLVEQIPYLKSHGKIKADELPLFDIMVISANEYGASTRMMIYGIDITDDAQVLSVEDLFTENTFNFVARDIDEFTSYRDTVVSSSNRRSLTLDTVAPYDFNIDDYNSALNSISSKFSNSELVEVQSKLVKIGLIDKVTGIHDNDTLNAIKKIQIDNGILNTGILDRATYDLITMSDNDNRELIRIRTSNGAHVYSDKDKSKVNGIAKCKDVFLGEKDGEFYKVNFYDSLGYISESDVLNNQDYDIKHLSNPGDITVSDSDYSNIGLKINSEKDIDIKVSAICTYENNKKDSFSKYIKAKKGKNTYIRLSDLTDAYIYNIAHKSKPKSIKFIILSHDRFIHSWNVKVGD